MLQISIQIMGYMKIQIAIIQITTIQITTIPVTIYLKF